MNYDVNQLAETQQKSVSHHRISSKTILFIGFTAILILMLLLTFLGPYGMQSIHKRLRQIVQVHIEKIDIAVHMRAAARERSLNLHKMILSADPFERDETWMKFNSHGANYAKERIRLQSMGLTTKEEELLSKQAKLTTKIIPLQLEIVELINLEEFKEAERLLVQKAIPLQDQVLALLEELYYYQEDAAAQAAIQSEQAYKDIRYLLFLLSSVVLLLSGFIAFTMYRKIRQAEIQNEQNAKELEISRDKAQAANTAKTQFLATMSHELRTPLNAVIGYSDLLLDDLSVPGAKVESDHGDFLEKIKHSGTHLLNIINEILNVSKIESGKTQITKQNIVVGEILELAHTAVQPMVHDSNNVMVVDYPGSIGSIYTDGIRLEQILINLLSNACKFTENGKITLTANREDYGNKNYITFTVSDTGIGIPQEHHERIFEPFSQADNSFSRKYEGVGLGLSVCKKYCQLLGGDIKVKSAPDEGSVFTVRLPDE